MSGAKAKRGTAETADAPAEIAIRAISPITHDGDDYAIGETLTVPPAIAARLIAGGAAQPVAAE